MSLTEEKPDVFCMDFDALIELADKLGVEHDEETWFDDCYWIKEECKLRTKVAEKLGEKS